MNTFETMSKVKDVEDIHMFTLLFFVLFRSGCQKNGMKTMMEEEKHGQV